MRVATAPSESPAPPSLAEYPASPSLAECPAPPPLAECPSLLGGEVVSLAVEDSDMAPEVENSGVAPEVGDPVALAVDAPTDAVPLPAPVSVALAGQKERPEAESQPSATDRPESQGTINYDDEGLLEVELDESQYRFDAGKQGTALCLSVRPLGTYRWSSLGELKWDGRDLRSRSLERKLLGQLSLALREFSQGLAE